MTVEIWSDILCPFCYIGKRQFELALEQFEHKDEVEVVLKSFELNPNSPVRYDHDNMHQMLAQKLGVSVEQAKSMNARVSAMAASVGLHYDMDHSHPTNSFDAHRVSHLADTSQQKSEMIDKIYKAHFCDATHIGDRENLTRLAVEIGIDRSRVEAVLNSEEFSAEVRAEESEAQSLGISGVPFFVFNRKYGVSGAQGVETFLRTLNTVADEEKSEKSVEA